MKLAVAKLEEGFKNRDKVIAHLLQFLNDSGLTLNLTNIALWQSFRVQLRKEKNSFVLNGIEFVFNFKRGVDSLSILKLFVKERFRRSEDVLFQIDRPSPVL